MSHCNVKDVPDPDGNGHRNASENNGTEWLIIYDPGVELILYQKNKDHRTTSTYVIETFVAPSHAECRIVELGFEVPPGGWQGVD